MLPNKVVLHVCKDLYWEKICSDQKEKNDFITVDARNGDMYSTQCKFILQKFIESSLYCKNPAIHVRCLKLEQDILWGGLSTKFSNIQNCTSIQCCKMIEEFDTEPEFTKNWELVNLSLTNSNSWTPPICHYIPLSVSEIWNKNSWEYIEDDSDFLYYKQQEQIEMEVQVQEKLACNNNKKRKAKKQLKNKNK